MKRKGSPTHHGSPPVARFAFVMSHGYDFDSLIGNPIDNGKGESRQ
jgi:hypothetical protein